MPNEGLAEVVVNAACSKQQNESVGSARKNQMLRTSRARLRIVKILYPETGSENGHREGVNFFLFRPLGAP